MSNLTPTLGSRNWWLIAAYGVVLVVGMVVVVSTAILLSGRYQLAGSVNGGTVWRIDTLTGDVSMCETYNLKLTPACGAWGTKPLPPQP
jgi:hypothetical protein